MIKMFNKQKRGWIFQIKIQNAKRAKSFGA